MNNRSMDAIATADHTVRHTRAETDAPIAARKIEWTRGRDDPETTWSVEDDSKVCSANSKTMRNIPIAGTCNDTDRGSIRVEWNGDEDVEMKDGCFAFVRDGETVVINPTDSRVVGPLAE